MRMSAYFLFIVLVFALASQVSCLPLSGGAISTRDKAQNGESEQVAANLVSQLKEKALQGDSMEKEDGSGSDEPKGPTVISTSNIGQVIGKQPGGSEQLDRPSFSDEEEEILRTVLITLRDNPGLIQAIMDSERAESQDEFYKQKARVSNPRDSDFWGSFQRPSPQVLRKPKQIEKKAGPHLGIHPPQQGEHLDDQNKPDTIGPLYLADDPGMYPEDEEDHLEIKPVPLSNAKQVTKAEESGKTSGSADSKGSHEISIDREGTKNEDDESQEDEDDDEKSNADEDEEKEVNDKESEEDNEDYEEDYEEYYDEDNEKDRESESEEDDEIKSDESKDSEEIGTGETDDASHIKDKYVLLKENSPKSTLSDNEENELLALSRIEDAEAHKTQEDAEPHM